MLDQQFDAMCKSTPMQQYFIISIICEMTYAICVLSRIVISLYIRGPTLRIFNSEFLRFLLGLLFALPLPKGRISSLNLNFSELFAPYYPSFLRQFLNLVNFISWRHYMNSLYASRRLFARQTLCSQFPCKTRLYSVREFIQRTSLQFSTFREEVLYFSYPMILLLPETDLSFDPRSGSLRNSVALHVLLLQRSCPSKHSLPSSFLQ